MCDLIPSGAKGVCSVLLASREGLRAAWAAWVAARSLGRVRASPWSLRECSFSWLMVIEEKGHDKHLYVCCSPGGKSRITSQQAEIYSANEVIDEDLQKPVNGWRFFIKNHGDNEHILHHKQSYSPRSQSVTNMSSCTHLVFPLD